MPSDPTVAAQFGTARTQEEAAQLGMWVFLATELLLFGGLFVAYTAYRFLYPHDFIQAATKEMEVGLGTLNTFLLLGSSVLVALADTTVKRDRPLLTAGLLTLAALIGVAFLCIKGLEYKHHFEHGAFPGKWYAVAELPSPGASMFITLYFLMTGLHALHMTVAVCVLLVLAWNSAARTYSSRYSTPVELGGMYWHLVDVIWVFLWPMFYLLSRR